MESEKSSLFKRLVGMRSETSLLVGILFLGLGLRIIAAVNLGVNGDEMQHILHAVNFFDADRLISYTQSAGLWHSFTSIIYSLFGVGHLASRFASIFFGAATVLSVYLLSKEFFSEKVSLIAAFFTAISPFLLRNTIGEMDIAAMFFAITSMAFFVKAIRKKAPGLFAISGVFLGLGIYTKVYPLLFVPSLLLYFAYSQRRIGKRVFSKKSVKLIMIFLVSAGLFALPALTHNYLLYKEKGFLDLQFTRTLNLGREISAPYYSWDPIWDRTNSWKGLFVGDADHGPPGRPLILHALSFAFFGSPISFILGVIGLIFLARSKSSRQYVWFAACGMLFIFPFLASIILLSKHFIFIELFLIPPAAFITQKGISRLQQHSKKPLLKWVLVGLLLSSCIIMAFPQTGTFSFFGKTSIAKVIEYREESIPVNSLVVMDSRIYRGRVNWLAYGRPHLEGTEFIQIINSLEQSQGGLVPTEVYYIECVLDDCGWGSGQTQGALNDSMEALTKLFADRGTFVAEFDEPVRGKPYIPLVSADRRAVYRAYHTTIALPQEAIVFANRPREWFLYTVGYEPPNEQFDAYAPKGLFDNGLQHLALFIRNIATILAFISPLFILYLIVYRRQ